MFGGWKLTRTQNHIIKDLVAAEVARLRDTPITTAGEAEQALGKIDRLQELIKDIHWLTNWNYC